MLKWEEIFSFHHTTGSKLVPRKEGTLRLINMAMCPYGHRALLVAEAKQIPLEIVNVDLTRVPEWMHEKNYSGVPVLEMGAKTIQDSLAICEFLDKMKPTERPMLPGNPLEQAEERRLVHKFQDVVQCIFPLFFKIFEEKDAAPVLHKLGEELMYFEEELVKRNTKFFSGDEPGFVDYAIWPFVERLVVMKRLFPSISTFDYNAAKRRIPNFERWRKNMEEDSSVKMSFLGTDDHTRYIQNRRDLSQGLVDRIDYEYVLR